MIVYPAIDIHNGQCVRLYRGDFATAQKVAEDPVQTARSFYDAGAKWIHTVDLDGAKDGTRRNTDIILRIAAESGCRVELGGGIRDMQTLEDYFGGGVSRCILGSSALKDTGFVRQAVRSYGHRIAVGIDAVNGLAAAEGWLEISEISYLTLAKEMESIGVQTLIFTDIAKDGTLSGPNFEALAELRRAVTCRVIASGGVRSVEDVRRCREMCLDGVICGKSLYSGTLTLSTALSAAKEPIDEIDETDLDTYFVNHSLIPAVIQEADTREVLMVAYMNRIALQRTLQTGETCFWSRSRRAYWHKGETSGHIQKVRFIRGDCDRDALLVVVDQTGPACHTGAHSCFFRPIGEE